MKNPNIDEIKLFSKPANSKLGILASIGDGLRAQAVAEAAILSIKKNTPIKIKEDIKIK